MKLDRFLEERAIPDVLEKKNGKKIGTATEFLKQKQELRKMLAEWEYGAIPQKPEHLDVRVELVAPEFAAGKAPLTKLRFTATDRGTTFSFPVYSVIPKERAGKLPAFVFLNFRSHVPDKYLPSEEIADRGYAVFSFCYKDITGDDDNFRDAGARFLGNGRRAKDATGKIAMWAWAAMRVMDYVESLPEIDGEQVAVIGHSRLGKTALLAGAFDERFRYVISNDSGCSGAALTRGKIGEGKREITRTFPFWFCPRYNEPTAAEDLPFDQNALLALIPPRHILIGSAEEDSWADPTSEFLNLYATNRVYRLFGLRGLVTPDEIPNAPVSLGEGDACYHVRRGMHYLSRTDWNAYMDYIDRKRQESPKK